MNRMPDDVGTRLAPRPRSGLWRRGLLALLSVAACWGCDAGSSTRAPDAGGGAGGSGAGGQLTDASKPADAGADVVSYGGAQPLPEVVADAEARNVPDCGPGCRIALKMTNSHAAWGHGFSTRWVADTNRDELGFAEVGSDTTWLVPQSATFARVNGHHIAYYGFNPWPQGEVAVIDAQARTRRVYFAFPDSTELGFSDLLLTDKHVIWSVQKGLFKANLETGAISQLSKRPVSCMEGCTTQGAIYCVNTKTGLVDRIDEETGELTHLNNGGALQVEGGCSPDRKKIVWVDYRPPGEPSGFDGFRGTSEIYLHDIPSGQTERLTFDSPENGTAKTLAAVGTDWVVWLEPCATCPKSYQTAGELYRAVSRHVRLDLNTRQKCYLDGLRAGAYPSLHGHHLYGNWSDGKDRYLVDLDLDHPELEWVCE